MLYGRLGEDMVNNHTRTKIVFTHKPKGGIMRHSFKCAHL
jgi:hypothetical protein